MVIRKEGKKWILYDKFGLRIMGTFNTKQKAIKRERQIRYWVHKGR